MDSLVFLCARCVIDNRPLLALPPHLYPDLFQAAFQDGRVLALRDLVAAWPFPELNLKRLLGRRELLRNHTCIDCIQAVIQAVVAQLRRELEEPGCHSRWLRVLDVTGVPNDSDEQISSSSTMALAKACVEVSKHQQEFQRRRAKRHKGCSGAVTAAATPQILGVDVHADLVVNGTSYGILHDALQTGATNPLRLKCREFKVENIKAKLIVPLFNCLDPSRLRRVKLHSFELGGLSLILPHLSRFPELRSLTLWYISMDVWHPTPESANRIRCVARQLGMLPSLRELNLGSSRLPGNLSQILCDLQAPLESLELDYSSLFPADFAFLSQSIHAQALKRLDLSGQDVSQGLLEPLRLLLEKTSASLLYLNLLGCRMADSHLAALLPTLLRCSRLRFLGIHDNPLSKAAVKDLLQKTLELPDLHQVVYPVPLECHMQDPLELDWFSFEVCVDDRLLSVVKAEFSQLLENSGRTNLIWTDEPEGLEALDYFSL
ncbi:LRC14 protein, partial [Copsychus sechellarum]|nr:LRC14 protein [Copsychus sechellarum]NXD46223.1 LRC14 protein [Copsychus sechellarum]